MGREAGEGVLARVGDASGVDAQQESLLALSWVVSGTAPITLLLDHGVGDVSALATTVVAPEATRTYMLTATNDQGRASAQATVTVTLPPQTLWAWGSNAFGQIGDGTTTERHAPLRVLDDVTAVAAAGSHSYAILSDRSLWSWGYNGH